MSLSTGFSPKPFGMILSRRRSSPKRRSRRLVVLVERRCVTGSRRWVDTGLEVVLEAGDRARQQRAVVSPHTLGEVTSNGSRRGLVAGARTSLELGPQIGRDLDGEVAHPLCETALSRRAREALLERSDDARSAV